ncbi:MAG TPA: type II secretion system F family protein [Pirellulales bacterium]
MLNARHDADAQLAATIASLVEAGLPIEAGLTAAARELPRGRTARALATLADQLARGEPLDQALTRSRAPAHLQTLVAAGLRSADLGRVLEEFIALERHADDVHRRVQVALAYPAILLAMLSGVLAFFAAAVVPGIMQFYDDFGGDPPGPTQMLAEYTELGPWMLAGNAAIVSGGWLLIWLGMNVPELRTMLIAAPLLGPILRWASLARFTRLLALLLESRLPLPQALRLAGGGCHDTSLAFAARLAAGRVEQGAALSDSLVSLRAFPESLGPILRWGEHLVAPALSDGVSVAEGDRGLRDDGLRHGVSELLSGSEPSTALSESLRVAAEMFEGRLEAQLGLLRAVVPPLTFLFVLWAALFLVSSLILPMIDLVEKLS